MNNSDMPAMPCREMSTRAARIGLTKREHFAAMAMQGFCSDSKDAEMSGIVKSSVMMADALLKELEENQ